MPDIALRPSLRRAPNVYDKEKENLFRRELEMILAIAVEVVGSLANGTNSIGSPTMKRQTYRPPIGVVTHG
jgi:hypothetical protein